MLEMRNIEKSFGTRSVLSGVDLTVKDGCALCVCGQSGCGKTTLMRLAVGLDKPDSGEITIDKGIRLSVMFQEDRLLPWKTAVQNITAVGVDKKRALHYLELTELISEKDKYPSQMSGGMRRRLSLARALAFEGGLYILDEPLTGLDEALKMRILELIKAETEGKSLLMITHDTAAASVIGAEVYNLSEQNKAYNGGNYDTAGA